MNATRPAPAPLPRLVKRKGLLDSPAGAILMALAIGLAVGIALRCFENRGRK